MWIMFPAWHTMGSLRVTTDFFIEYLNKVEGVRATNSIEVQMNSKIPDVAVIIHGIHKGCYKKIKSPAHYRVGYGVWEAAVVPKYYKQECETIDFMITPSNWCKDLFVNQGFMPEDRVHIVPSGVNLDKFHYQERPKRDTYTIFSNGWVQHRKGFDILVEAFKKVSKDDGKMKLVIHGVNYGKIDQYKFLTDAIKERSDIVWDAKQIPFDQVVQKYYDADLYIKSHRCEGFDLTTLEAMATGLPVIVTGWSGNMDFCNNDNSYLIKYKMQKVLKSENRDMVGNMQAEPDVDHLADLIKHCYENRDEALNKGRIAAQYVADNFRWEQSIEKLLNAINLYIDKPTARQIVTTIIYTFKKELDRLPKPKELEKWTEFCKQNGLKDLDAAVKNEYGVGVGRDNVEVEKKTRHRNVSHLSPYA